MYARSATLATALSLALMGTPSQASNRLDTSPQAGQRSLPTPAMSIDMTVSADNSLSESIGGSKLTLNNALAPENIPGAKGMAWRLDGYSNYAKGSVPTTGLSTSQLTISLWCAPESYPMMNAAMAVNEYTFIAGNLNDAAKKGFAFMLSSQGEYKFECYTGGWKTSIKAREKMPLRTWSHLVATINTNEKKVTLYNNGVVVASAKCFSPINVGESAFIIGKSFEEKKFDAFHLNTFNGLIDDLNIYNTVLSEAQIANAKPENKANLSIPTTRFEADMLRPAFHGMPAAAWTNESHGVIWHNGKFHLFFQKNPNGPYMARLNWGHLTSANLYNWQEELPALMPNEAYDSKGCWSGAVFADEELTGGQPNIFYTAVDNAKATIAQAIPNNETLLTWERNKANPIINGKPQGLSDDFRDPYVFKNGNQTYMVVGTSKNGIGATTLHKYNPTTKTWTNDGTLFFAGSNAASAGTFWEMPVVTPLGNKWLFAVTPLNTAQGVETIYWTGDISADGKFIPTSSSALSPSKLELDGMSKDGFGLLSPSVFKYQDKVLLLGIVPDKLPGNENYRLGWAHAYSLPREISLDNDGLLVQKPFSGLQQMRSKLLANKTNLALNGEEKLATDAQRKFEIYAEFTVGTANMGLQFYKKGNKAARIFYRPTDNSIVADVSAIDRKVNDAALFNGIYSSTLPKKLAKGSTLKLHVFVDRSVVDVFINDTWAFSLRVFPTDTHANDIAVFGDKGSEARLVKCWTLNEKAVSTGIETAATGKHHLNVEGKTLILNAESQPSLLQVFDLAGRMLATKAVSTGSISIELPSRGVFLVRSKVGTHAETKKIIIN